MPTRIQLSRRKGWRLPPNTVNVAAPVPEDETRGEQERREDDR